MNSKLTFGIGLVGGFVLGIAYLMAGVHYGDYEVVPKDDDEMIVVIHE